jgi:hypothetical protein
LVSEKQNIKAIFCDKHFKNLLSTVFSKKKKKKIFNLTL